MPCIEIIFKSIEETLKHGTEIKGLNILQIETENNNLSKDENLNGANQIQFLKDVIKAVDVLSDTLKEDDLILISVQHQKVLRTCFQIITSLGFSQCLIPGLGISLSMRCSSFKAIPSLNLDYEEKYQLLTICTDFFIRSYNVPVLKNIIITLHLSDYLAALIQLCFAPYMKPGSYKNYVMTEKRYSELLADRTKYTAVYEHLVKNSFQPLLMKELLVLQGASQPAPPAFVKNIVSKEMSQRLLAPDGLKSLIRCFIENYGVDTGFDWKKIEMICKIVVVKHGVIPENEYLKNMCSQICKMMSLNNTHYLMTAVSCIFHLIQKYPQSEVVQKLSGELFHNFDTNNLRSKSDMPGTIIMTSQEIEHKVNLLHISLCIANLNWPKELWISNIFILYVIGMHCFKSEELKGRIKAILMKCLEMCDKDDIKIQIKSFLISKLPINVAIEKFEGGLVIKASHKNLDYPEDVAMSFFLEIFKSCTQATSVNNVFESCTRLLLEITTARSIEMSKSRSERSELLESLDVTYAITLQLMSEICTSPNSLHFLDYNSGSVLKFIEQFIMKSDKNNEECVTIALVFLNTILSYNKVKSTNYEKYGHLIPILKNILNTDSHSNKLLSHEAIFLILDESCEIKCSAFSSAINNICDKLLPVRAHGIMELTKLIEAKDEETIAKRHYIYLLLQEQLQDTDSYIYLSAINGIAKLGAHFTEDVINLLCKEFLNQLEDNKVIETSKELNRTTEMRLKVGDIIVKLIKQLGEIAVVHKTVLLNTMLTATRDDDPLIRASALSNIAEIALIINYKMGTIIYEVLQCIFNTLDTDKAIECRRAAVMIIASLLKGLGRDTLVELKENLLPIYRSLKNFYNNPLEDQIIRLHSQIALEELNDIVSQFIFPQLSMEKRITVIGGDNKDITLNKM